MPDEHADERHQSQSAKLLRHLALASGGGDRVVDSSFGCERAMMVAGGVKHIVAIQGFGQLVADKMTEQFLAQRVGNARVEQRDAQRLTLA